MILSKADQKLKQAEADKIRSAISLLESLDEENDWMENVNTQINDTIDTLRDVKEAIDDWEPEEEEEEEGETAGEEEGGNPYKDIL